MIESIKYTRLRFVPIQGTTHTKFQFDYGTRGLDKVVPLVDLQNYKYFFFEDRESIISKKNGIITVQPKIIASSGKYFIDAYIEPYEDVLINNQVLANKMKEYGWKHIVRGIKHYWTEVFDEECDKLISINGEIEK